jgi:hypothetical protein
MNNGMEMNVIGSNVMKISRQPSQVQIMIDKKQLESVEYLNYLCSVMTHDAHCIGENKSSIALAKTVFNKKKILHKITRRKANWIGHTFLRNIPLKLIIEGKI